MHDALQRDEVFPDLGRDAPQIVVSGAAFTRERNPPGNPGARDACGMMIPEIDREQGTHSLDLPSEAQTKTSSESSAVFETSGRDRRVFRERAWYLTELRGAGS